jgi:GR25 family glycosyltransferase involved in LPS biosynthesis
MFFTFTKNNTFCISLERHKERWARMQERFENEKLDVTRWIASTPETLTDNFHNYLSLGERACAQSHANIWRHIVKNNIEYALILEDDACFDKEWRKKLDTFSNINDPSWDLILLNASEPVEPNYLWVDVEEQYLTAGYIISNYGAQKVLHWFKDKLAASDWMTSRIQQNHHSYCYFPWLIIQEGKDSTLKKEGETHDADHKKVVKCLGDIN